jgi:putative membrane protein
MRTKLGWILKGAAMGAANVIPGVSGGTIAFITGIYERLIHALKSLDLDALRMLFKLDFKAFSRKVDLVFLAFLFVGIAVSILSLAKLLELALTNHEAFTLAFFFGLIIASVLGVGRQISKINAVVIIGFLVGTAIAVAIAFLPPATANDGFFYLVLCGMVAICSMILPGLSGSYILLLMGNYLLVLQAISGFEFRVLLPIGVGCAVGLVLFSRLLSYLFAHFRDLTIALLTGFVAGSLLIIWPWKNTIYMEVMEGKEKAIGYEWLLPPLDLSLLWAVLLMMVGFVVVYWMEKVELKRS